MFTFTHTILLQILRNRIREIVVEQPRRQFQYHIREAAKIQVACMGMVLGKQVHRLRLAGSGFPWVRSFLWPFRAFCTEFLLDTQEEQSTFRRTKNKYRSHLSHRL